MMHLRRPRWKSDGRILDGGGFVAHLDCPHYWALVLLDPFLVSSLVLLPGAVACGQEGVWGGAGTRPYRWCKREKPELV